MCTICSLNFISRVLVGIFLEAPLQCTPVPATYAIICYRQCSLTRAVSCRAWKCLLRREGETRHVAALGGSGREGGRDITYLLTGWKEGRRETLDMCAPHHQLFKCARRMLQYIRGKRVTLGMHSGRQVDYIQSEWILVKNSWQLSGQL